MIVGIICEPENSGVQLKVNTIIQMIWIFDSGSEWVWVREGQCILESIWNKYDHQVFYSSTTPTQIHTEVVIL